MRTQSGRGKNSDKFRIIDNLEAEQAFNRSVADKSLSHVSRLGSAWRVSEGTGFDTAGSADLAVYSVGFRRRVLRTLLSRVQGSGGCR